MSDEGYLVSVAIFPLLTALVLILIGLRRQEESQAVVLASWVSRAALIVAIAFAVFGLVVLTAIYEERLGFPNRLGWLYMVVAGMLNSLRWKFRRIVEPVYEKQKNEPKL